MPGCAGRLIGTGQRRNGLSSRSVQYTLTATKATLDRAVAVERILTRSEVMAMTWGAVDFESGTVEVRAGRVVVGRGT